MRGDCPHHPTRGTEPEEGGNCPPGYTRGAAGDARRALPCCPRPSCLGNRGIGSVASSKLAILGGRLCIYESERERSSLFAPPGCRRSLSAFETARLSVVVRTRAGGWGGESISQAIFFGKIKKRKRQCNSECFPGAVRGAAPGRRVETGRGLQGVVPVGYTGASKSCWELGAGRTR